MKKRLLTLMLVAFVLCTMAINSFALMNEYGQPLILKYSNWSKSYGEYNWRNDNNYQRELFYYGYCNSCGKEVTYINVDIPVSVIDNLTMDPNSNDFGDKWATMCVGSYYDYNRYGFKPSNYLLCVISDTCDFLNDDLRGRIFYSYGSSIQFYRPYVHYKMDLVSTNGMVDGGWYVAVFNAPDSNIGSTFLQYATSWRSAYETNRLLDLYIGRQRDVLLRNFTSSEFVELSRSYIYDEGYDKGLDVGSNSTFNEAYQEGYNKGLVNGQDMSKWSFAQLFDGLFNGFSLFIGPFFSLGINDITIGSFVSLVGIAFMSMLLIKIVRGA